ncbi:MAG TPA: TonB-dependent receptor [Candidatus Polarisedimenticolaceae bacterium]|nr:TonB-dependent receptor [Candidatus Polarisedimenticolaceae bacterium]
MEIRWIRMLFASAAACLLALSAWAQTSTTGVIEGRVRDQAGNPVADATVTAVANRAPAAVVTDAQGRYTLSNLPPGTYKVRAEAQGKAPIVLDEVSVSINTRTRVDVTLVTGQTETVTVTAEAPVVDTKSVTTGGNFKVDKFVDQIPVGRNLASTLTLAPGVASGLGTGAGNYAISGSSGLENSYIVDGVNITNTGYGGIGSYNIVYGSLGTGVTYDFLEEVQVKTGGIDAEYGQATGGVVNTVVKTGTNDLSGAVSFYGSGYTDQFAQADLFVGATNNNKGSWNDSAQYDLGLSVGGPIVKDKLFYFVAYNPVLTKSSATVQGISLPTTISNGNPALTQYDPPSTYPASIGIQTQQRTSNNYAGKLTWYANPNHRLELTAFGDPSTGDQGPQRLPSAANGASALKNIDIFTTGGGLSSINYGGNNYSLKYDAVFTPTFFMQAQVGRHDGKFEETSELDASRYTDQRQLRCFLSPAFCTPGQSRDNAATWNVGGVGFISNQKDINNQAKVLLTWVAGNNELKGGASYDMIRYTDAQDYTGPDIPIRFGRNGGGAAALTTPCADDGSTVTPCYVLLDTRGGVTASARQNASTGAISFRATRGRYSPDPGPTQTDDMALFVQDTFTFAQNWTLKAGVRASQQKIKGSGDYSLTFYYDDGLRTPESSTAPAIAGQYTFDWAIAPRVGLTWDATGDGRSKLYVNAARYYERVPNDLAIRALSNEADLGTTIFNAWDPLSGPTPGSQTNGGGIRGGQTSVQPGTKLPFTDEYVLGWQQELGRDVSYEIRGIYREEGRALEDTQFNTVEATENYYIQYYLGAVGPGGINRLPFPTYPSAPFAQYVLANPGENTPAGFPKAVRKYYALEAILNKRFSDHWLFYGNMRFSHLYGNYEGLFRNDNGQSDPNVTSLFDFPNSGLLAGQFQPGVLNTDVPFAMKLYGSYQMDNGVAIGAALNVSAGTPRTPLLAHPNGFYQNAGEVPGKDPVYYWYTTTPASPCGSTYCLTTGTPTQFFDDPGAYNVGSWAFPHLYSYDVVKRGFLGRTAMQTTLDLSATWSKNFSRWATFGVGLTVFNVLNSKETILNDDDVELQAGVTDPDYLSPIQYQNPRSIRAFAKWSF